MKQQNVKNANTLRAYAKIELPRCSTECILLGKTGLKWEIYTIWGHVRDTQALYQKSLVMLVTVTGSVAKSEYLMR